MIQLALLALLELWIAVSVLMRAVEPGDYIYGGTTLVAAVLVGGYAGRITAIILRSKNRGWGLKANVWEVMLPIRIVLFRGFVASKAEFATTPAFDADASDRANWMRMLEIAARGGVTRLRAHPVGFFEAAREVVRKGLWQAAVLLSCLYLLHFIVPFHAYGLSSIYGMELNTLYALLNYGFFYGAGIFGGILGTLMLLFFVERGTKDRIACIAFMLTSILLHSVHWKVAMSAVAHITK